MSMTRLMLGVAVVGAALLFAVTTALDAKGQGVPRIELDELKAMLGSPDLLIVDVRRGEDWEESELKIKGAVRENPREFESWFSKYPKDKTIVFYCA